MQYRLGKTRNGTYEVRWTEPGRRTKSSTLRTKDKNLAEERLEQFAAEHSKPVHQIKTIRDACDAYYDEMKHGYQYPSQVNDKFKPIKEHLGNLLVTQVNNEKALEYYHWRNCANSTVRTEIAYLKAALKWAKNQRGVEVRDFDYPCPPSKPRQSWLTKQQVKELYDACVSHHLRLFIVIAVTTGQRGKAICQLQWSRNIDFTTRIIDFGENVGKKHRSKVPMNEQLYRELQIAFQVRRCDNVIEFNGKPVKDVKKALIRTARKCGHDTLGKHVFRHTCATWLVMARRDYGEIGKLIGASAKTVEDVYGHNHPDYLKDATETLNFH